MPLSIFVLAYLTHFSIVLHVFSPQSCRLIFSCMLKKIEAPRTSQWVSVGISKTLNFALLSLWRSHQGSNHLSFVLKQVKHMCVTYLQHIDNHLRKLILRHGLVPERSKPVLAIFLFSMQLGYTSANNFYMSDKYAWPFWVQNWGDLTPGGTSRGLTVRNWVFLICLQRLTGTSLVLQFFWAYSWI